MPPRKSTKKPEHEVMEVEPSSGFRAQLSKYETLLKGIATIVASFAALYTALWAIGMAPMTNAKTAEVLEDRFKTERVQIAQNLEKQFDGYDKRMKDVETSVKSLNDAASRVDERTRSIQEEQRSQRDLSNKILMELQNKPNAVKK
jgi:Skp family chaperone for outer membrane proteins